MDGKVGKLYEGSLVAGDLRFAIVCGRFNEFFVKELLDGAIDCIIRHGGSAQNIRVAWVPGSFEIPVVARKFAVSGKVDAVIGLGTVIQGATAHAEHVNAQAAAGLASISVDTGVPAIYGVVTTENLEQAIERSGSKAGNRGASAAMTAIEMANLLKTIESCVE